jgi:hypothetical protein
VAHYAVVTTGKDVEVAFGSCAYDVALFLEALRASGLPDSLPAPFLAAHA